MKKLLLLALLPLSAQADQLVDARIRDQWSIVERRVPHQTQVCEQVQVPVYREAKPDGGAILLGAIIGNAIGRAAGVDGGQTAGTVIGGIAGAEASKNNREIDHFETQQRCQTQTNYTVQQTENYNHSIVEFVYEGRTYRLKFQK